ncbi:MAG: hypothetical protein JO036_03120 [Candidatus Eremiobacteraeota bacterium]|nr:hypothetical protein [Candidatus Eremiobacteraeota bacterium]
MSRLRGAVAFCVSLIFCTLGVSLPRDVVQAGEDTTAEADVLIQAGHEGRPDCDREPATLCRNTGAAGEIEWTPVVADEATRILRAAGVTVIRRPAFLSGQYDVKDAIFLHFDGNANPCTTGASVGYPQLARSAEAAAEWKSLWRTFFPFRFEPDNFTSNLSGYYGFRHVRSVSDAAIVIEGGEMSCPAQHAWLKDHLKFEGALIAHFLSKRLGKGDVPLPKE